MNLALCLRNECIGVWLDRELQFLVSSHDAHQVLGSCCTQSDSSMNTVAHKCRYCQRDGRDEARFQSKGSFSLGRQDHEGVVKIRFFSKLDVSLQLHAIHTELAIMYLGHLKRSHKYTKTHLFSKKS